MANSLAQRSFAAGEVAPAVYGRADIVKYQSGLAKCRNFLVRRHGGITNRPGFQMVTEQVDSSVKGRIWKFVFNSEQTYVLLFGEYTMRVVSNGSLLTVSGLSAWNGAVNYAKGDLVSKGGVNYYAKTANIGADPAINPATWYAMPADGTYEVQTNLATAILPTLYFSQSADVITITEPTSEIYELARYGHTNWQFSTVTLSPSISAPGSLTVSGVAGTVSKWVATSIKATTLEESIASTSAGASTVPTAGAPRTLTIGAVAAAQEYNVYRHDGNGTYGYIGTATGTTFIDTGFTPDYTRTPPAGTVDLTGSNDRPACSGYLQQRKCYGGKINAPEEVYASKVGQFYNFTRSSPLQDDDACIWIPASSEVNKIRHFVEVSEYWVLTQGAEWIAFGDANGSLTPSTPNLKKQSSFGSAEIQPIIIGSSFLFVQQRGSIIRDIKYEANSQGYSGRDLTVFSAHLFEGYTLTRMDYAQIPNSVVWVVRSDGKLLALTYLRDHEVWGWSQHDTDGEFEDVVVVPEGNEDRVYCLVKRTIDGNTVRYLERMASRSVTDTALDATFMDSFLTYNGWNTGATTMTLSGGATWAYYENLTLTASSGYFVSGDVDNTIVLRIVTETYSPETGPSTTTETLTCTIIGYTSATEVTVLAEKDVPVAFRNVAFTDWGKGVDQVAGLDHLEGATVAILADGAVVTNGIDDPTTTVESGSLSSALERPAVVIHVGLPYCAEAQTLDLEVVGGETLAARQKSVNMVTVLLESSRGLWAGEPNEDGSMTAANLYEFAQRAPEDEYDIIGPITGKVEMSISTAWNKGGRVHVRQRDPLPLSILAIIPSVEIGG